MTRPLIVTGTDTDIGKTVAAAGLTAALGASYWKPVQAGVEGGTDSGTVARLAPDARILPEAYRLATPASPHLSARLDGIAIDPGAFALPEVNGRLVVEGAGGLMVPLSEEFLLIDLFARWRAPVVLCARTALGTINHSLLSVEALKARHIPIAGILFVGEPHAENERVIPRLAEVAPLGRLPRLDPLDSTSLLAAMRAHVDLARIEAAL